jgi:micrococcal nuclease
MRKVLFLLLLSLLSALVQAQVVTRVVDGDTIIVSGVGSVRLIGVDTPETVDPRTAVQYFGAEASAFTKSLAQGKTVRLE